MRYKIHISQSDDDHYGLDVPDVVAKNSVSALRKASRYMDMWERALKRHRKLPPLFGVVIK